jgi:hypothetical protein
MNKWRVIREEREGVPSKYQSKSHPWLFLVKHGRQWTVGFKGDGAPYEGFLRSSQRLRRFNFLETAKQAALAIAAAEDRRPPPPDDQDREG